MKPDEMDVDTSGSPPSSPEQAASDAGEFQFTFESLIPSASRSILEDLGLPGSCSVSLTESLSDFPEEFGRTYHAYKAGSYYYPNDAAEQDRLDLQNAAFERLCGGRLFFAPFTPSNPPKAILDIATGTGDWAIRMGEFFPNTKVMATDLSPIQPTVVPPNVYFYVEDSSEPWIFNEPIDYVHTRGTAGCWESFETNIAAQAFKHLSPGGYLESLEAGSVIKCVDGTLDPNGPLARWFNDMTAASAALGRPTEAFRDLKNIYERVGFRNVQELILPIPMNEWPSNPEAKIIGAMWRENISSCLSTLSHATFTRAFGLTIEDIEVALIDARRELADTNIHAYMDIHIVWGQKPLDAP